MTRPWTTLASVATREGALELRRRGDADFLITIAGRILMTSAARRSEQALSTLGCAALAGKPAPRVLIGGLGMGYTLRAALDALPAGARVTVAELTPEVVEWCRGPMAALTAGAVSDPRVTVVVGDVAEVIARAAAGSFDAILLDLYEGPRDATQRPDDPFYGRGALERSRAALAPGGVLAVWSEDPDAQFERRFRGVGFDVETHKVRGDGRVHLVYLGKAAATATRRAGR